MKRSRRVGSVASVLTAATAAIVLAGSRRNRWCGSTILSRSRTRSPSPTAATRSRSTSRWRSLACSCSWTASSGSDTSVSLRQLLGCRDVHERGERQDGDDHPPRAVHGRADRARRGKPLHRDRDGAAFRGVRTGRTAGRLRRGAHPVPSSSTRSVTRTWTTTCSSAMSGTQTWLGLIQSSSEVSTSAP